MWIQIHIFIPDSCSYASKTFDITIEKSILPILEHDWNNYLLLQAAQP